MQELLEWLKGAPRKWPDVRTNHLLYLCNALALATNQPFPRWIWQRGGKGPVLVESKSGPTVLTIEKHLLARVIAAEFKSRTADQLTEMLKTMVWKSSQEGTVYTTEELIQDAQHLDLEAVLHRRAPRLGRRLGKGSALSLNYDDDGIAEVVFYEKAAIDMIQ